MEALNSRLQFQRFYFYKVCWNLNTLRDFVVMRSKGQPVYNFCVTVDDATMAISNAIRAEEYLPNTLRKLAIGIERIEKGESRLCTCGDGLKPLSKR
ncbi:glutamate--tRNA ligase, chloroplastic/mitochondrial-like isoform X1 [Salvia miltiorrhiza]|uniref:glutamate--tRNA ligase, chloroplastic/mitochondrial-like isoform X1 n=1 Tax=Salvia miltiorrhiza TaxID=226208 RepID=UPI0025AC501C|nr:glutamate--tRNA ligase, chloroplastic/mitochondrial-like isoform X1 [Salvia miltiorrhiza]